jgi:hypothetical protein
MFYCQTVSHQLYYTGEFLLAPHYNFNLLMEMSFHKIEFLQTETNDGSEHILSQILSQVYTKV